MESIKFMFADVLNKVLMKAVSFGSAASLQKALYLATWEATKKCTMPLRNYVIYILCYNL